MRKKEFHGHSNRKLHGGKVSPTYQVWQDMKKRCINPGNKSYAYYGGRGIKVCSRWVDSFANFLKDMGERPDAMTLDRIDSNGHYEPDNCRWATRKTQTQNRRPETVYLVPLCDVERMVNLRSQGKTHEAIAQALGYKRLDVTRVMLRVKRDPRLLEALKQERKS